MEDRRTLSWPSSSNISTYGAWNLSAAIVQRDVLRIDVDVAKRVCYVQVAVNVWGSA